MHCASSSRPERPPNNGMLSVLRLRRRRQMPRNVLWHEHAVLLLQRGERSAAEQVSCPVPSNSHVRLTMRSIPFGSQEARPW